MAYTQAAVDALDAEVAAVVPQNLPQGSTFRSCGDRLKTILVVQAAEVRFGDYAVDGADPMAAGRWCERV